MIEFRYHIVSLVAVLLALCVGIVVGSGLLGGPLLEDLESRAEAIRQDNADLRGLADERFDMIEGHERFAREAESRLVTGVLQSTPVVIIEAENTDGEASEGLRSAIELAGGETAARIRILNKMSLGGEVERDLLALAVQSTSADNDEVRSQAAQRLSLRLAAAEAGAPQRLTSLLESLEEGGFVEVEREEDGTTIPEDALFVLIAGADSDPAYDVASFYRELAVGLADRDISVLVAEPSTSSWGVTASIQDDGAARDVVGTTEGIETTPGRIAAVLTMEGLEEGSVGHHGPGEDSETVLPPTSPEG